MMLHRVTPGKIVPEMGGVAILFPWGSGMHSFVAKVEVACHGNTLHIHMKHLDNKNVAA